MEDMIRTVNQITIIGWTVLSIVIACGYIIKASLKGIFQRRQKKKQCRHRDIIYKQYLADPTLLLQYQFKNEFRALVHWSWVRKQAISQFTSLHCRCCGMSLSQYGMHVDHIKPKSKYPVLKFHLANLQPLCGSCNSIKGTYDGDDWKTVVLKKSTQLVKSHSLRRVPGPD